MTDHLEKAKQHLESKLTENSSADEDYEVHALIGMFELAERLVDATEKIANTLVDVETDLDYVYRTLRDVNETMQENAQNGINVHVYGRMKTDAS